ncbi:MAG TPA: BTAD domain-containing putative transcriptional regulator [Longimicrobiales bacterium]
MAIRIVTLGGLSALQDGAELAWLQTQRLRAALLVYLAVERTVSRAALTTLFWPESDEERARHALRQNLYELRRVLGDDAFDAGAREIRVTDVIDTDVRAFDALLERGDAAAAARLYQGPFLHGAHLIDQKPWEVWVDGQRAQSARAFRRACRDWVASRRTRGDLAGAIEAAQHWIRPDPLDDEAQHALIELLAESGQRADALHQYEAYSAALAVDGLEPLDETKELSHGIRRDAHTVSTSVPAASAAVPTASIAPGGSTSAPRAEPSPADQRPRALRRRLAAAAAVAGIALAALLLSRTGPAVSPTTVAVLPFSVSGGADAGYLAEGMVDLLSRSLDGAGDLRAVDPATVLRRFGGDRDRPLAAAEGRELAGRLGAGMYVIGSIHQAGGQLRVHASLGARDEAVAPLQANAEGDTAELFSLVDEITTRLLTSRGARPFSARAVRSAGRTTTSLAALKAFLTAEQALRGARYAEAIVALERATAEDSTFALAWYRIALARIWSEPRSVPAIYGPLRRALAHAERLSDRDRRLLEALDAFVMGSHAEAERRYRLVLQDYPDDLEAAYQLGLVLYQHNPLVGRAPEESAPYFERVLAVDPEFLCPI